MFAKSEKLGAKDKLAKKLEVSNLVCWAATDTSDYQICVDATLYYPFVGIIQSSSLKAIAAGDTNW